MASRLIIVSCVLAGLLGPLQGASLPEAWSAPALGLPVIDTVHGKNLGAEGGLSRVQQDSRGRVFIGSNQLIVSDGAGWLAYPIPNANTVTALALGTEGRVWIGASNECGFFQETLPGVFAYHSLLSFVPPAARDFGIVWGCGQTGGSTFFICQKKILHWDGRTMQIIPLPTQTRLSSLTLGSELWVHHLETGLHRLTEQGLRLEIPARDLPPILVIGLFRDAEGLVTVSNQGFVRPGAAATPFSSAALNQHLGQYRVSAFAELPDGQLVIGTLSGGLVLASRHGDLLRAWSSRHGLPGRNIQGLGTNPQGHVLGITGTHFFHFSAQDRITVFNTYNGLPGEAVNALHVSGNRIYAVTEDGGYQFDSSAPALAAFAALPLLKERYHHLVSHRNGVLLARFGGVDYFDGQTVRSVYRIPANWTTRLLRSRFAPGIIYAAEATGVATLAEASDGTWTREQLFTLPDAPATLQQAAANHLWIGTTTRGAYHFDPTTRQLTPVHDPLTQQPFTGRVLVAGTDRHTLFFTDSHVYATPAADTQLRLLANLPAFTPQLVEPAPDDRTLLVALQRPRGTEAPTPGLGLLNILDDGTARWRELDLPAAPAIGTLQAAAFSAENQKSILWLGGTAGILRVDYESLPTLSPPPAPTLRLANPPGDFKGQPESPVFSFRGHRVQLAVLSGDYVASRSWLVQTRLAPGDWSAPAPRHRFEYTNLSEGAYRFEARVIDSANQPGPTATLTFVILPPWYRSGPAYAAYAVLLLTAFFGSIRVHERRIRARNQELEKLVALRTADLVQANAAKDEFLASVSHEIRNPMNGVIGIAETFPTAQLDAESRHKFSLLHQCASHLSALLEDILDFSRVQAEAVELDSSWFDVRELLRSIAAMTAADSEKYGLPVEIAVSPAVPAQLAGDPRRIRQILLNLVGNALKFAGRGQISVTVWCQAAGRSRTEVIFAVSDEGPGISEEDRKKLFTRFARGAAAQKGRVPGTGIGLALCKALAEKMGGRLWLESEVGRGACFCFSAPFATKSDPPQESAAITSAPASRFQSALVVDDEEYNRVALADLLTAEGLAVQTAATGPQAVALSHQHAFDAIFLDYDLPGMTGVEIARALRAGPGPSAQAVLFATTAFNTPAQRAACLAAGMNAFLTKPVTQERLHHALRTDQPAELEPAEPEPVDPLANLRLLAAKKRIPLAKELALFLDELERELTPLQTALAEEAAAEASHYAHLLYGRCGFIHERKLADTLRAVEAAAATGRWPEARRLAEPLPAQIATLKSRLLSA